MSLFKKVARAFVVVDENQQDAGGDAPADGSGLEAMTKDTGALLAQLESRGSAQGAAEPGGEAGDAANLTAEDVFRREGITDDANAAPRLIKLVAGLTMFPKEQQLTMVRAMDAADDTWSEDAIVADARKRVELLRAHLDVLAREREQRVGALGADIQHTREGGSAVLAELDRQIAELYARREREAAETAAQIARLEQEQANAQQQEARARQGIGAVIHALSGLLTFLGVPQSPEKQR